MTLTRPPTGSTDVEEANPLPENGSTTNMRSLDRAVDVLEVLEDSRQALRLSEIARRAGLHVATAQRILAVLERRGRVEHDDAGYRIGVTAVLGAHSFLVTNRLVASARPVLQELAAESGLTASLFVRTGWSRAVLARVEGSRPMRYELPIGERLPLYVGAGKVLAAELPREELTRMLNEIGPMVMATGQRLSRKAFLADLTKIRQQGFSVAISERVLGMASVAAPVLDQDGGTAGAVQVAGTTENLGTEQIEPLSVEVRRAAAAITHRLS